MPPAWSWLPSSSDRAARQTLPPRLPRPHRLSFPPPRAPVTLNSRKLILIMFTEKWNPAAGLGASQASSVQHVCDSPHVPHAAQTLGRESATQTGSLASWIFRFQEKQTLPQEQRSKITKNSSSQFQVFGEDSKPSCDVVYYLVFFKKRITDVFSFLLPLLGTHYSFPGPVPENGGGFRNPYHLPDTVTSFCPHNHAARQTLMSPLFRQGSQDSWLRAEVTQLLLWVSWPPVRG